jgi:hypothetical protein
VRLLTQILIALNAIAVVVNLVIVFALRAPQNLLSVVVCSIAISALYVTMPEKKVSR